MNDKELLKATDFEKLNYGSLVRFKCFFNLNVDIENIDNKLELSKAVSKHFAKLEVNSKEVIEQFLQIEKDLSILNTNSSARKSIRNQEKVEKYNINKVLDSFKQGQGK